MVRRIEVLVREGRLGCREVFIFTDNFVFGSTYYKGYSKISPKILDIIMRLHKVEIDGDIILH